MSEFYNLKVKEVKKITPDSVSVVLEILENLKEQFKFKPGQFVMVEKELNGEKQRRYYSICNVPNDKEIKLGIKFKGQDGFAGFAMNTLKPGDVLQVSTPMNDVLFELETKQSKKYLGVTIGSGITPFYSYIQHMIKKDLPVKFILIYGNETPEKTMFYHELKQLAEQFPDKLKIYWVFSKDTGGDFKGRINSDIVRKITQNEGAGFDSIYMIGPDDLKKSVAKVLEQAGVEKEKMHYRVYI